MRAALLVSFAALLAACADQTGVLVQITSSDIAVPSEIDGLHIRARTPDGLMVDQTFAIRSSWPQSLLIRPTAGEALGELQVEVTGTIGGAFVVQRAVMSAFMPGQVRHLDVELSRACLGMVCGEYNDCVAGVCQGMTMPDAGPTPHDGGTDAAIVDDVGTDAGGDGGHDAGPDAAGPCAGATCVTNVVISEMSTYTSNEFVELYNRGASTADVSGCVVEYFQTGTWSGRGTIAAGTVLPSHGYLLLTNVGYAGMPAADQQLWNTGFADANAAVRIACSGTMLDLLGYGTGAMQHEGTPVPAIDASILATGSYERRAFADSTPATMSPPSGRDLTAGNGFDTDDNASDFLTRSVRDPQSSVSPHEPP
jgi:hypothetical protein